MCTAEVGRSGDIYTTVGIGAIRCITDLQEIDGRVVHCLGLSHLSVVCPTDGGFTGWDVRGRDDNGGAAVHSYIVEACDRAAADRLSR